VIHAGVGRQIVATDRHRFGAMHGPEQEMHGDRQGQHERRYQDEKLGPTGPAGLEQSCAGRAKTTMARPGGLAIDEIR